MVIPSPASLQRERIINTKVASVALVPNTCYQSFGVIYLVHSIFNHIIKHKRSKEESGKTLVMPPYHFPLHCVDLVMNEWPWKSKRFYLKLGKVGYLTLVPLVMTIISLQATTSYLDVSATGFITTIFSGKWSINIIPLSLLVSSSSINPNQ